jgi:aspartate/tyrosine/aromatic aminotransferase
MNYQNNSSLLECFRNVQRVPDDVVFGVTQRFLNDKSSEKINGFIGTYVDNDGNNVIFKYSYY